jgi:hypothetical protein
MWLGSQSDFQALPFLCLPGRAWLLPLVQNAKEAIVPSFLDVSKNQFHLNVLLKSLEMGSSYLWVLWVSLPSSWASLVYVPQIVFIPDFLCFLHISLLLAFLWGLEVHSEFKVEMGCRFVQRPLAMMSSFNVMTDFSPLWPQCPPHSLPFLCSWALRVDKACTVHLFIC